MRVSMRSNTRVRALAGAAALAAAAAILPARAQTPGPAPATSNRIRLHLIYTNDIHGHVAPEGATFMNPNFPPPLGGGASAATYIQKIRDQVAGDPTSGVLLVDAGDVWQGAPVGTITQGTVMEEYFKTLDYDVVVLGNHEFDKGKDVPIRMSRAMKRPFVCANMFLTGTDSLPDWVEPYRIINRAGLRIGIVGGITPGTSHMAFEENIAGLDFRPLLPEIEKWRDYLYTTEKVDVVMAVIHDGLPFDAEREWQELRKRERSGENIRNNIRGAMDLAHVLERVPVIVGGHTHRGYRDPWIDPVTQTMVLETFGNGSSLGHIELEFDPRTRSLVSWQAPRRDGLLVTLFEDEYWPDAETSDRLDPFIATAQAGLDVKVGSSRVELTRRGGTNSTMGNFVTEAIRSETAADFAFVNLGGLRTDLPAGNTTIGDLLRVMPFDNALAVVQMPGRMIRDIFERKGRRGSSGIAFSGAKVIVDPDASEGERVRELLIGDQPLEPDKLYRVCTTDYLLEGNSGLDVLTQIPPDQVQYLQVMDRIAVSHYLEKNSPVNPRVDDRWRESKDTPMASYLRYGSTP